MVYFLNILFIHSFSQNFERNKILRLASQSNPEKPLSMAGEIRNSEYPPYLLFRFSPTVQGTRFRSTLNLKQKQNGLGKLTSQEGHTEGMG